MKGILWVILGVVVVLAFSCFLRPLGFHTEWLIFS